MTLAVETPLGKLAGQKLPSEKRYDLNVWS